MKLQKNGQWKSKKDSRRQQFLTWLALPLNRHGRWVVLFFWLLIIGGYWRLTDQYGLSPEQKIQMLEGLFIDSFYGPLLFVILFALQPLVFFPSFFLGIAGGILYGPVKGIIYVILGANGAANICYSVGRFFGHDLAESNKKAASLMQRSMQRLRRSTFETILIMHLLIVIPFDIVNYLAGFLKMKWKSFALATMIGAIPGIFTFVLFGHSLGSLDNLAAGRPDINIVTLLLSGLMLLVGLTLSQIIKQREEQAE